MTTSLEVEGVWKAFAGQEVLRGASLAVEEGAIVALLGSSGCGKTTLLRAIAGFEAADAGRIELLGRVLEAPGVHVPAERRHIGYVPQEGTLFPHLTVEQNVGFGLSRAERRSGRVGEALRLTGLEGLEGRYPHQISGGQQQRTALARALAPQPGLVLLDEPFAALDMQLRQAVCADVVGLLRAHAATAILVTHDPQEAFTSADVVMVMQGGVVVQGDAPATLYRRPVSEAVARLTGATLMLDGVMEGGRARTVLGLLEVYPGSVGTGAVRVMLRPEQVVVAPGGEGVLARRVSSVFRGDHMLTRVVVGGVELALRGAGMEGGTDLLGVKVVGPGVVYGVGG